MEVAARRNSLKGPGAAAAEPQKGCWKIDLNDEACYIDVDVEDEILDPDHEFSQWHLLPNLVLEEVFAYLDVKERYYASLVCRNWYSCFYLPRVWSMFLVDDHTLTRQRYNYYSGWQHTLDHLRTQYCLHRIGRHIKGLDFRPLHSFNNLFQFMNLLSWCIEQSRKPNATPEVEGIGARITTFNYLFPCNMAAPDDPDGIKLFGTGGQLLAELKRLLGNLATRLRNLQLTDLMLERYEAKHLLDEVLQSGQMMLRRLSLVNVTTVHCPIMHVGLFLNLQTLIISPQNIDDDVLLLFADSRLRHLHILQNCYTPSHRRLEPCSVRAWRILKRDNPKLMVHLRVEALPVSSGAATTTAASNAELCEILWQPEAPVHSVLYRVAAEQQMTKPGSIIRALDLYKSTLTVYGHELLDESSGTDNEVVVSAFGTPTVPPQQQPAAEEEPEDCPATDAVQEQKLHKELQALNLAGNGNGLKGAGDGEENGQLDPEELTPWPDFDNRIDSVAVLLARQAPNLSVLLIKDPVSTATLLLIARAAVNLERFYVLRDTVRCACDWPPNPDWTPEFYEWLTLASASVEATEREIGQLLHCPWRLLDLEAFQKLQVDVR